MVLQALRVLRICLLLGAALLGPAAGALSAQEAARAAAPAQAEPAQALGVAGSVVQVVSRVELAGYFQRMTQRLNRPIRIDLDAVQKIGTLWKRRFGTGFILSPEGHVLTTWSVVAHGEFFDVRLQDGSVVPARLVAADPYVNLAILRIVRPGLKPARLSEDFPAAAGAEVSLFSVTERGELLRAVGSVAGRVVLPRAGGCPLGVSVRAATSPITSGGPCVDSAGRVVGMISGLLPTPHGDEAAGDTDESGFRVLLVPVESLLSFYREVGRGSHDDRAWFGLDVGFGQDRATGDIAGAWVLGVQAGGPAHLAGILPGDRILSFHGRPMEDPLVLFDEACSVGPGEPVPVLIERAGGTHRFDVLPMARPDHVRPLPREWPVLGPDEFGAWLKEQLAAEARSGSRSDPAGAGAAVGASAEQAGGDSGR